MKFKEFVKTLNDMEVLYGDKTILTITDGESEYSINQIIGQSCAQHFNRADKVAEVIIGIQKRW